MRLQLRLSLSYLLVALFCSTAGLTWLWFSGLPAYRLARRGAGQWMMVVHQQIERAYARGGLDEVRATLNNSIPPPDTDLTLFEPQAERFWGEPIALSPLYQQCLEQDHIQVFMPRPWAHRYKAVVWFPIHDPAKKLVAVGALAVPARLPPDMREIAQTGIVYSLGLGAGLSLLLAFLFTRRIARPVEALSEAVRDLGQGNLDRRLPVQGRDELADLARYFNATAENVQRDMLSTQSREASQRQFLADISHNLRTPLAAIQGWVEALQDGLGQGEEAVYLDKIHRQTRQIAVTVSRLLELSRWQSADPLLHRRPTPLSAPLMEAVDAVAPAAEARGVRLQLDGDLQAVVEADPDRLRDVFQVLLENCVQHGGAGIEVTVSVVREGERVRICVQDSGAGGSAQEGLGLSIARRLVEAHGGEFHWESVPGQGTKAEVTLSLQSPGNP